MAKTTRPTSIPTWFGQALTYVSLRRGVDGIHIMNEIFTTFAFSGDKELAEDVFRFKEIFDKRPQTIWAQLGQRYTQLEKIPYKLQPIAPLTPSSTGKKVSVYGCWNCRVSSLNEYDSTPCTKCKGLTCNKCKSCLCNKPR